MILLIILMASMLILHLLCKKLILNIIIQFRSRSRKNSGYENVKERKILYENSNKKDIEKTPINNLQEIIENTPTNKITEIEKDSLGLNGFQLDPKNSKTNLESKRNQRDRAYSDNNNEEEMDQKTFNLIKHLISFEGLRTLKALKIELKEIIENIKNIEDLNNNNELNLKLHNFLKSNIFLEIFDNLISKYFQNFYKAINTNPEFTSRLENILLFYFKSKNNITTSSLLDFDQIFHSNINNSNYSERSYNKSFTSKIGNEENDTIKKIKDIEGLNLVMTSSKTLK
jgi:hypothetical protein